LLPHSSSDNHAKYREPEELEQDRQVDPIARLEMQLVEAGILDEKKIEAIGKEVRLEVDEAAKWADEQPDPAPETATSHVYFEGDLGLDYATDEPTGEPLVLVDAVNQALREEMKRNDKVLVYGEDVAGGKGGVFTATRDLTKKFGKDRCFNSPLAEASIIGTAVGLSAGGFKPVVEIQFADYIWPAMQQLRNQVAPFRYRSNNAWSCPMVIRVPCGGYIHGGLCHSQNIESIFGHMPGFVVTMPSTAADAKGLLKTAIRSEDPVIFLEHKALYRAAAARTPAPDADYLLPLGKARMHREGSDLTIITYGMMVHKAMNVARQIEKEDGASVEIIDLRTLVPLDTEAVLASVQKTNRVLVLYEDHEFLGYGAEIAALIADKAFAHLDAPVRRLAGAFSHIPFADPLERAVLPQDEGILEAAREVLAY
jgi:2-oxoisovalerate dehydrogenase E1 component